MEWGTVECIGTKNCSSLLIELMWLLLLLLIAWLLQVLHQSKANIKT